MWTLYMLRCADGTLYTGITTDLERRIDEHNNSPKGAKFTRGRRPVECVFSQEFENRSEASKEEMMMKKLTRPEKLELIKSQ
ncbi:MAG: GIY-YIG nuclease family protein [Candidatus Peregrinibacteria bacterium]|nr:GIY-YIG nuclease family protein [Candidatus Peregrinibacteria bacterium]